MVLCNFFSFSLQTLLYPLAVVQLMFHHRQRRCVCVHVRAFVTYLTQPWQIIPLCYLFPVTEGGQADRVVTLTRSHDRSTAVAIISVPKKITVLSHAICEFLLTKLFCSIILLIVFFILSMVFMLYLICYGVSYVIFLSLCV